MRPQPQEEDIPPVRLSFTTAEQSCSGSHRQQTNMPGPKRAAAAQAPTEQCPTGTHLVGTENGVINCSFD